MRGWRPYAWVFDSKEILELILLCWVFKKIHFRATFCSECFRRGNVSIRFVSKCANFIGRCTKSIMKLVTKCPKLTRPRFYQRKGLKVIFQLKNSRFYRQYRFYRFGMIFYDLKRPTQESNVWLRIMFTSFRKHKMLFYKNLNIYLILNLFVQAVPNSVMVATYLLRIQKCFHKPNVHLWLRLPSSFSIRRI